MAKYLKGFLDNLFSSALNPKGNLADYQHAARLFVDDSFKLAPKQKFLYHVCFNMNDKALAFIRKNGEERTIKEELNMLVKSVDLPKFTVQTESKNQYNKRRKVQTKLEYDPITIVFHDDNYGITTAMWEMYYRYHFRDGTYGNKKDNTVPRQFSKGNQLQGPEHNEYRFGMDNDVFNPFFSSIQIYQMSRGRYTCYTLVNPLISMWQHDTMNSSNPDPAASTMTIEYETVFYSRGPVKRGLAPKGFGDIHYDKTPSPLSLAGGGTRSLFGLGGVLSAIGGINSNRDAIGDVDTGTKNNFFTLKNAISVANRLKNFKSLSKEGLREEGFRILTGSIGTIGTKGVGGFINTVFPKNNSAGNDTTTADLKKL